MASRALNANGFELLNAVERGDIETIRRIDRAAYFERSRKLADLISYKTLLSRDKVNFETLNLFLLERLLNLPYG